MSVFNKYSELISHVTPPARILILLLSLMLVENGLALTTPWLAGQLTKNLVSEPASVTLSYQDIIFFLFAVISLQALFAFINRFISGTTSDRMLLNIRTTLYDHLQRLPLSYHHEKKHGETLALITNDCSVISSFITGTMVGLVPTLLTAVGALICIGMINLQVALLAIFLIPFFYVVMKLLGRRVRPVARELMDQYGKTFSIAEENLSLLSAIKIFTREGLEAARFRASNDDLYLTSRNYLLAQARMAPIIKVLATVVILVILLVIGDEIASGAISTSDIVSLLLYGMLLTQPISRLADTYGQFQRTTSAADRLLEVLNSSAEELDTGSALPPARGAIMFSQVCFAYPNSEPVIDSLSAAIKAGETIAITGKNGAGKSTLIHLLMRFMKPDSGTITIDGHDIADVSLLSLRKQIGLVEQNVLLQNATVRENILFGKPDATYEEVIVATEAARANQFIEALPDKFDTIIGDQGIKLSGGQKQRIALARALVTDPAILILDEATAMFDPDGEMEFIQSNRELLNSRTVIIITHRPASLALANRIFKLENGTLTIENCSSVAETV